MTGLATAVDATRWKACLQVLHMAEPAAGLVDSSLQSLLP